MEDPVDGRGGVHVTKGGEGKEDEKANKRSTGRIISSLALLTAIQTGDGHPILGIPCILRGVSRPQVKMLGMDNVTTVSSSSSTSV